MNYGILFCIIVNMCILKFYMWGGKYGIIFDSDGTWHF